MTDDKIWEEKDKRMARMSAFKDATEFVSALVGAGFYKADMDADIVFQEIVKYQEDIFNGIYDLQVDKGEKIYFCEQCNRKVSEGVKSFCDEHYKGHVYCISCQEKIDAKTD